MRISKIRKSFNENRVIYSGHAKYEMDHEEFGKIYDIEVEEAILNGVIIERYQNDEPYPSALIFGRTKKKRPIHIVCAYIDEDDMTVVITVYQPDPTYWINYTNRRKK